MLRDFAVNQESLLQELAQTCETLGWVPYVLADSEGKIVWPLQPDRRGLPKPARWPTAEQVIGEEQAPAGWCVVPLHAGSDRVVGSVRMHARDASTAQAVLKGHAVLLEQILAREEYLGEMATELMSVYDRLVAMYRVSQVTRSNLDLDGILHSLLEAAVQLSKARHGFVALQRETEVQCITAAWSHPRRKEYARRFYQEIRQRGQALACHTPADLVSVLPDVPAPGQRCLVMPIAVGGEIVAALGLLDKPTSFTAGDRKLLTALADELGGIIERARLRARLVAQERMHRELEIAADIQIGLLPTVLPQVPGLDVAARSVPANEVGGDFYDFICFPDRPVAVVLGDVTSKGVPAALFVTVAHTILNSAFPYIESPQALLQRLNVDMYDDLTQSGMFITLFVAYYDPSKRRLVRANAGHSPVLFYEARTRRSHLWEADGPPIGVLPDVLSADKAIDLGPGDVVALMSDGFNEMTNPSGDMFGIERLERLLEMNAGQSAAEILDRFYRAVADFAQGVPPADDMTICVLKAVSQ